MKSNRKMIKGKVINFWKGIAASEDFMGGNFDIHPMCKCFAFPVKVPSYVYYFKGNEIILN